MNKEKKEWLETIKKLDPEIRADVLAHARVAYAAQENTKRRYGLLPGSIPVRHRKHKPGLGLRGRAG